MTENCLLFFRIVIGTSLTKTTALNRIRLERNVFFPIKNRQTSWALPNECVFSLNKQIVVCAVDSIPCQKIRREWIHDFVQMENAQASHTIVLPFFFSRYYLFLAPLLPVWHSQNLQWNKKTNKQCSTGHLLSRIYWTARKKFTARHVSKKTNLTFEFINLPRKLNVFFESI